MEKYILLDLTSLSFRTSSARDVLAVLSERSEILMVVDVPPASNSHLSFLGCEALLQRGSIRRDGETFPIALYNPFSAQVSVGAADAGSIFVANRRLVFEESLVFELESSAATGSDDLGEFSLTLANGSFASLSRSLLAHQQQ